MIQLVRIVQATVINAITVYGVFGANWTVATAVALYWSENVIGIVLISLLFVIHHLATHKRGHNRGMLKDFILATTVFTLAHGIFLAFFILLLFPKIAPAEAFDPKTFRFGLMLVGGVMVFNFLLDAAMVKFTPFANIRAAADSFMPRILVVHLTIIFGMLAMAVLGHPRALFAVFAALKFGADLLSRAPKTFSANPPRWITAIAGKQREEVIEKWHKEREATIARMADDELVQA
jgi:hypothetical protein